MHIGVNFGFGRANPEVSEHELFVNETDLAVRCEGLGFDSVWAVEHHFTDYSFCPDNLQWLAYVGAKTSTVQLATGAVILPWHDPLRVAERLLVLDNLTNGRVVFGMGRGLSRVEYEALRAPIGESRERFDEMAPMILEALETGFIEGDGPFYPQPRVQLKPGPIKSFRDRVYTVAGSADSIVSAVANRARVMSFIVRPVDKLRDTFQSYRDQWEAAWQETAPPICLNVNMYCHRDPEIAQERMYRYVGAFWQQNVDHYEFTGTHFATTKGYERYAEKAQALREIGVEQAGRDYADAALSGTPEQIRAKLDWIQDQMGEFELVVAPSFGGMPHDQALESLTLFAEEVVPPARERYDARVDALV